MSFLNYLTLSELANMYGLSSIQLEEIRRTVGVIQGLGMVLGLLIGLGVGYIVWH